jgi:hypothetical protein
MLKTINMSGLPGVTLAQVRHAAAAAATAAAPGFVGPVSRHSIVSLTGRRAGAGGTADSVFGGGTHAQVKCLGCLGAVICPFLVDHRGARAGSAGAGGLMGRFCRLFGQRVWLNRHVALCEVCPDVLSLPVLFVSCAGRCRWCCCCWWLQAGWFPQVIQCAGRIIAACNTLHV